MQTTTTGNSSSNLTADDIARAIEAIKHNSILDFEKLPDTLTSRYPERRKSMPMEIAWIEGALIQGHFLVLPERSFDVVINQLRELGFYEEAIDRIYKSHYLPAKSDTWTADGVLIKDVLTTMQKYGNAPQIQPEGKGGDIQDSRRDVKGDKAHLS